VVARCTAPQPEVKIGYVFSTPAGLITLFALGIEAAIALILALASGLSELHKDLLVGFAIGFPALTLVLIVVFLARMAPGGPTSPEEP
jgi:hypothetical protein